MSSTYYLFLNLAFGCFALSILCIRGQRLKNRYASDIGFQLGDQRRGAVIGIGPSTSSLDSAPHQHSKESCVCIPESPYRFMNMWEIISESSFESRQSQ